MSRSNNIYPGGSKKINKSTHPSILKGEKIEKKNNYKKTNNKTWQKKIK